MYEYLSGKLAERTGTSVIVDVGGVGYELLAPLGAPFGPTGEPTTVWAHLVVREDAQTLYGFPRREERDLFRVLLRVRGVGPAMGLGILSGLPPVEFAAAIQREDVKALTAIKGVGKKTAEQIVLDLKDKSLLLVELAGGKSAPRESAAEPAAGTSPNRADAVLALVSIGYKEKEAEAKVEAAAEAHGDTDLEALVRAAMRS
ncbi:MAG: Holliday junction branch migration protein RuvA [Planctomycetota bacterium]